MKDEESNMPVASSTGLPSQLSPLLIIFISIASHQSSGAKLTSVCALAGNGSAEPKKLSWGGEGCRFNQISSLRVTAPVKVKMRSDTRVVLLSSRVPARRSLVPLG